MVKVRYSKVLILFRSQDTFVYVMYYVYATSRLRHPYLSVMINCVKLLKC